MIGFENIIYITFITVFMMWAIISTILLLLGIPLFAWIWFKKRIIYTRIPPSSPSTPSTALVLMTQSRTPPEQIRHTPSPSVPLPQPIHNTPEESSNPQTPDDNKPIAKRTRSQTRIKVVPNTTGR